MNPYARETYAAGDSMAAPQPMEGLHDAGPPPFLTKTYEIVDDSSTNQIISWSRGNNSFIVWDPQAFSMTLLPRYFKHSNFSSFVRQLNTYGFRKVDPDRWEFANESFLRGQRHLLKCITRRKTQQLLLDPCVEVGRFGFEGEIDSLKRDKQVLMAELVKLRQQQHKTRTCLQVMEEKLKRTEMKQQQMMGFLAKAMKNPSFVQQLIHQKDKRKELEEAICTKRRRRIDNQRHKSAKPADVYDDINIGRFEVSEFDQIATDLQPVLEHVEGINEEHGSYNDEDKRIGEGFWNDFLNDDMEEETPVLQVDEDDIVDVDVLVEHLGFLGSSPK
ncbi:Heat stress transcription factor A-6b [Hibiscus syriacus]|uniref:Heat stress transcription factor A-6b n=1 Tax=Hibiscus syriacus TaxID=106335 RepID=A0A6A3CHB2_HIBSY|nr:heat stress transcription factor A-6b-like [Hibiscus syriacus]KAE8728167.1 Heat stress transcription factor A-6b [Hibiscus syriacus]